MGYADGVLSGLIDAKAFRATLDAREAERKAHGAEMEAIAAQRKVAELEQEVAQLKEIVLSKTENADRLSAVASAGLVVMNAMLTAIDNFPEDEKRKFLEQVAKISKSRIKTLDQEREREGYMTTIDAEFAKRHQYEKIGMNRV